MGKFIKYKKRIYIHETLKIGWLRVSFFRLGRRFSVRLEIAKGWE